jgi:CubicO group peptidase (beta-lactamase class C family)
MTGFPPKSEDQADLSNWRTAPYCHWAFHHVREIVPSAEIANDPENIWPLQDGDPIQLASLEALRTDTATDAVVLVQNDSLRYEAYANGMAAHDPHILMSVSKSMLGLLAGIAIENGALNEDDLITDHIPEVANTVFNGATVRDALDMRVGVEFDEDYTATSGPIIDYRYAANWNPVPEGVKGGDLRSFMSKLTKTDGPHGGRFHYVSPNTDLLAWLLERATGTRYADLMANMLWKPLGAERSGYITVDPKGGARAAGGMCVAARDLARVGRLIYENGARDGAQIIPRAWLEDIWQAGDRAAWDTGDFAEYFPNEERHYRSKWYVRHSNGPIMHGLGIHGQFLLIDPELKLSLAWLSSNHDPIEMGLKQRIIGVFDDIREMLK